MLKAPEIENAKPQEKPYKLSDSGGLYLLVTPNGARCWRLKYYLGRTSRKKDGKNVPKEKVLALGQYPAVKLKDARDKRDAAKRLLAQDPPVDPGAQRKAAKSANVNTFESVGREWHE